MRSVFSTSAAVRLTILAVSAQKASADRTPIRQGDRMRRLELLIALVGSAALSPFVARAQSRAPMARIAMYSATEPLASMSSILRAISEPAGRAFLQGSPCPVRLEVWVLVASNTAIR